MRNRLPWILVAVCLAFNVFFTVGFLRARSRMAKARTFRGRAELMARRLELDQQQRQAFERLLDEMEQLRKARTPRRDALLAEIVKDEPDEQVLETFVSGDAAIRHRRAKLALMRKFIALLRPEQRERFEEMVKERSWPSQ